MTFLAPKIVLTPLLVASASLAGRRWGAFTSGWLLALPLTSGPIALFISLDLGQAAGAQAAAGSIVGAIAQVAFTAAYALASARLGWATCLAAASLAFVVTTAVVVTALPSDPLALYLVALASIPVGLGILGTARPDVVLPGVQPGRWDIPARAVVATTLVIVISGAAPIVGGHAAGIIATFPVYVSVLATFAHRVGGPSQARAVLRGLLIGLPGFATFFLVVSAVVTSAGVWPAFALALALATALNLASLLLFLAIRRRHG